jgi:5'-AMP-activated protein kinase regulatory beta subunit
LTYSPQIPMEPIAKMEESRARAEPDFHGLAGWPATPKLVPVVIVCKW